LTLTRSPVRRDLVDLQQLLRAAGGAVSAAIFNLNHPAHTVHWHFFVMSVANVTVIVVMLVVFAVAILAPFPGHGRQGRPT
jgi:hypothetical protein